MSYLWITGAVVVVAALVLLAVCLRRGRPLLLPTLAGSIGAFLLVTGWLAAVDAGAPKHEAIKTGGLAGGSIVALYALWLNDRRRRTDEARQEVEAAKQRLESDRAEHDRSRVADERFARSVELLGHETEQVRTGAMHALAGLARSRAEYTQTVLDVLCAYLRRPYDPADDEAGRELEVRLTAQRLVADLLPRDDVPDAPRYDLNLTRAYLEYFDLSHRQIGGFTARAAWFAEANSMHHSIVHGGAWFTESRSTGRLYLHDVRFHGEAWFSKFRCDGPADFARTAFRGPNKFADARFAGPTSFEGAEFTFPARFTGAWFTGGVDLRFDGEADVRAVKLSPDHDNAVPDGWTVDDRTGQVRR